MHWAGLGHKRDWHMQTMELGMNLVKIIGGRPNWATAPAGMRTRSMQAAWAGLQYSWVHLRYGARAELTKLHPPVCALAGACDGLNLTLAMADVHYKSSLRSPG